MVRGVGQVWFLLDFGELLEVSGVLCILGLKVSILSVSSLDDAGYSVVFQRELIFTYPKGVDPVLMGHQIDKEYIAQSQPTSRESRWISESSSKSEMDLEQETPNVNETLDSQFTS